MWRTNTDFIPVSLYSPTELPSLIRSAFGEPMVKRPFFMGKTYHLVMTHIAMERSTIFKNGKPSISMGHGFHGYVKSPEGT